MAGDDPADALGTVADGLRAVLEAVAGLGPCAVLLVGAAGSGKSTLARQLAGDGDQALSIDALCQLASGDPYDHARPRPPRSRPCTCWPSHG